MNTFKAKKFRLMAVLAVLIIVTLGCTSGGNAADEDLGSSKAEDDSGTETDSNHRADTDTSFDGDSNGTTDEDTDTPTDTGFGPWSPPTIDINELPNGIATVNIDISSAAISRLDADPFDAEDELGTFTDGNGHTYADVDVNYRGAYQLQNVIEEGLRNWKVKFAKEDKYRDRREWNFNYEPHLRQKLALDLLKFAGVAVPSRPQHVLLSVNGNPQGMYLSFEDPDNKDWLWEMFGHDDGDLYKAALDRPDIPSHEKCFADFSIQGPVDADYMCHYNKKTNHKVAPNDYSFIRLFIEGLNNTDDTEMAAWFELNFDVDAFISYLVVSNFIANWDSYPQRPKNFWVYQNIRQAKAVFIPWDLDATFHSTVSEFNQMGSDCSIFFNLEDIDYTPYHSAEGTLRPLARRLIAIPTYRAQYIARYRELTESILNSSFLEARIDALTEIITDHLSSGDSQILDDENGYMKSFIDKRTASVADELETLP